MNRRAFLAAGGGVADWCYVEGRGCDQRKLKEPG
jgi:hypothetical protein